MPYDPDADRGHFLRLEYDTLFSYYLWSLRNRHALVALYVTILAVIAAACAVVLKEGRSHSFYACGVLLAAFAVIGYLFVKQLVGNTVTTIWACCRLNAVRLCIRNRTKRAVFRAFAAGTYREDCRTPLTKYQLRLTGLVITLNSLVTSTAVVFLLAPTHPCAAITTAPILWVGAFVAQRVYINKRLDRLLPYLKEEARLFKSEGKFINTSLKGQFVDNDHGVAQKGEDG